MKIAWITSLILISQIAIAQKTDQSNPGTGIDAVALVTTESQNKTDKNIGMVSVTPSETFNPNELQNLRNEIKRNVFTETTKRFGPETFTFFVAVGAVTYNTMWLKSGGDPLAMERHIKGLKDPLAHISFFAFMQANGHYSHFKQLKSGLDKMDEVTYRQMVRRISYEGLAVGSLASSIVSDVGMTIQQCANKWLEGKKDNESLRVCDQALASWRPQKLFLKYFPQIISLWTSQALTEVLEGAASKAFTKVTEQNAVRAAVVTTLMEAKRLAYKIKAVDIVLTLNPFGGVESKVVHFVGSVARIGAFVAVDHVVSQYINRPLNNILMPAVDGFDLVQFNNQWAKTEGANWNFAKNDYDNTRLEESISKYTEDMQNWRNHLTSNLEQDYLGWTEMTKKLLNQVDYSYKFYNQFASTLKEQLEIRNKVGKGELEKSALSTISNYPQRVLPFYGVKPGEYKTANGSEMNDLYLTNPQELEIRQKEHVLNTAQKYRTTLFKGMTSSETGDFLSIINNLLSGDNTKMGQGLLTLRQVSDKVSVAEMPVQQNTSLMVQPLIKDTYTNAFKTVIKNMRSDLGDPMPIMWPLAAFSQAVASNSIFRSSAEVSDFDLFSLRKTYQFTKTPDLMMYNLICGGETGYLQKTSLKSTIGIGTRFGNVDLMSPEFKAPSLLKNDSAKDSFCRGLTNSTNLYAGKINNQNVAVYVMKNFKYDLLKNGSQFSTEGFEKFWFANVSQRMNSEMKIYDKEYRDIVSNYILVLNNKKSVYNKMVDKLNTRDEYFSSDLSKNLKNEMNVYLQIINRATGRYLDQLTVSKPEVSTFSKVVNGVKTLSSEMWNEGLATIIQKHMTQHDYLTAISSVSQSKNFVSIYGKRLNQDNEHVQKLHVLLNQYLTTVQAGRVNHNNFKNLILVSKDIDTEVNEILVQIGLKKAISSSAGSSLDILGLDDMTNEVSKKQYEDVKFDEKNLTTSQKATVAAIKGLRQVEGELKKYARMQVSLAYSLAIENEEMKELAGQ